jgi:hypothetical protein
MADIEVDYPRLYWLSFTLAGVVTLVRAAVQGLSGVTLQTLLLLAVGVFVSGVAIRGLLNPDDTDAPTEPSLVLLFVVLAAAAYSVFTLATLF